MIPMKLKRMLKKRREKPFEFKEFSQRQQQLYHFWAEGSPHKNKDIVIADGAIRSGKTIAMICSFLSWSQTKYDGEALIIAGRSIGALKRNVIEPMLKILKAWKWPYDYNRSENYIIIGSNVYYLFGASNESSQDVIQGLTAAGAFGDEAALFPQSFLNQMIGRCSVPGAKVFLNCNPKGPFHWFKTEFIDKAKEKMICYLHFTMDDNLTLDEGRKAMYERMYSGMFYLRNVKGLWVAAEGLIYDMFEKAKHVADSITRKYEKYYVSCDYGTQNATTFGLWALCEGVWYKVKEYHYDGRKKERQKTDAQYYDDLEEFVEGKTKTIILDPSAASFRTLLKQKGWRVKKAKNDVLNGIRNVATALNEFRIKYLEGCKETFREYASYRWCDKALAKGEDKPVKEHDHHMDGDRYFVNTILYKKKWLV